MKRAFLVVFVIGCQAKSSFITGTSSTTPSGTTSSGSQTSSGATSSGGDDRASGAGDPTLITLPDTVGLSRSEAEEKLRAGGVTGEIKVYNDPGTVDFAIAKVCIQQPGGGQRTRASLFVSLRYCQPEKVVNNDVPDLRGLTLEEAKKRAREAGFKGIFDVRKDTTGSCKTGTVCSVSPYRWNIEGSMIIVISEPVGITLPD